MIDQILQDIERQGWSYRTQVLSMEQVRSVSKLFEGNFTPAKVGKNQNRQRVESIRSDWTLWLDPKNPPNELQEVMFFLTELMNQTNRTFYLGLKDYECHLAKYPPAGFYKKHLDRFSIDSSRSLSFIFYLNQEWTLNDGGELVLYHQDQSEVTRILPMPGSFVCFLSGDFPHEVLPAKKERRSLTGWIHTKYIS